MILSVALVIVGVLLRLVHYLGNRSLWVDEAALARNIVDRGPLELLTPLDHYQAAPPLFLLLVDAATIVFGSGELALRLVPVLASLVSVVFFFLTARLFLDRRCLPVAIFIFVVSDRLIFFSQELKQYSVDVAVAVVLTYFAVRLMRPNDAGRRDVILLGLLGSIAIFLSHPAIIVLAGMATALIALKVYDRLDSSALALGVLVAFWAVCFLGSYLFFLQSLVTHDILGAPWQEGFLPFPMSIDALKVWSYVGTEFLAYVGYEAEWQMFVLALAGVSVGAAIYTKSAPTLMIAMYFVFALGASVAGGYPFLDRLILYLFPFLILLTVKGLQILSQGQTAIVHVILTLFLLAPTVRSLPERFSYPILQEEVRPLMKQLDTRRRAGDRVYVYYGAMHAVQYYRRDDAPATDVFHYGTRSRDDRSKYLDDIDDMRKWERVWFLFAHTHGDEKAFFLSNIDGTLLEEYEEYGASLYLFRFDD